MFNKKTFSKLMVAMAAVLSISVSTAYAQQDYSRSYQFGGVLRAPNNGGGSGGGATQRPILEVGSSFDAGGVLGCSGLDISGMLENTFNVGNLGDEFKNYLQNTIATEALSLLYSQPGVSQVLDGMKAIGHARVSIQQERCNANEIFADVTNRRLRDEAHAECLRENGGLQTSCEGSALEPYVEAIAQSRRWSGTLHDHVCEEGSRLCDFLPNFAYDVGTGEGQSSQASVPPSAVSYAAESAAVSCLQVRGAQADALIEEVGYSEALRLTASGDRAISCDPDVATNGGNGGGDGDGEGDGNGNGNGNGGGPLAGYASVNECIVEAGGKQIDVSELTNALRTGDDENGVDRIASLNPMQLVQAHAECILSREIHPHVDINVQMLPQAEIEGAQRAIAQTVKAKASVNLYNALITALSEALINSGSSESSDSETSVNPHTREFIIAQLEAFKAARDSILMDVKMSKDVAQTVTGMNERLDDLQGRSMRSSSGALSGAAANGGLRPGGYGASFR